MNEYLRIYSFDWDDNVIQMPTNICISHKETKAEIKISTEEYALERKHIGIDGKYLDYELIADSKSDKYSFRFFRDVKGSNIFLEDFKTEYNKRDTNYRRSWTALVHALSDQQTAKNVSIITARGHSPQRIYEVFKFLNEEGIIANIPKRKNIYPVAHIEKEGDINTSEIKADIICNILDSFEKSLVDNEYRSYHKFSFSDDDLKTIRTIADIVGKKYKNGSWKQFVIHLFYTGTNPDLKPGSYVIDFDGKLSYRKGFVEKV